MDEDNLIFQDNMIYILPIKENQTIKIVNENLSDIITEKYTATTKEILLDIFRYNYTLRKSLTRQQIHSERGKIRRNNCNEVIKFLIKRGFTREYINNEINRERERLIITKRLNAPKNIKIGLYQLD